LNDSQCKTSFYHTTICYRRYRNLTKHKINQLFILYSTSSKLLYVYSAKFRLSKYFSSSLWNELRAARELVRLNGVWTFGL